LIEFRWTRSTSTLRFDAPSILQGAPLRDVTLNQFHMDFTREFVIPEVKGLRSFLTGSVGATHVAAARDSFTRFSFGFGAGLKQFLGSRFAIRAEAKWLPILIDPEVGAWACGTLAGGGCLVVLTGPLTQQFELSVGPVVRFSRLLFFPRRSRRIHHAADGVSQRGPPRLLAKELFLAFGSEPVELGALVGLGLTPF